MTLRSGIAPFDERIEGLRPGGLYLLAAEPGAARFAFLLQFLDRGLRDGESVVLVSGSPPEQTIEQADYWGIDLATPWKQERCILLGFRTEYLARASHSPDPGEPFAELDKLIGRRVTRLAVDPGTLLWEARPDASMAGAFVAWSRDLGATTLAAVPIDLEEDQRRSTEWVGQRARGVFQMARDPSGMHEIEVVRLSPPRSSEGPVTLELAPGLGLIRPSGKTERRRPERPDSDRLLLLNLADQVPQELAGWIDQGYSVESVRDARECIGQIRAGGFGSLCIYADRERIEEAIDTGRHVREFAHTVMLLLSDESLRAADAARALDSGFDDVLSGGVDLRELESRFRRASESPRSMAGDHDPRPEPTQGPLDADSFRSMVTERLISQTLDHFTLLNIESPLEEEIGLLLFSNTRANDGDLVGPMRRGWGVLLQSARAQQAESFLQRLRTRFAEVGGQVPLSAEILAAPAQSERIRSLLSDQTEERETES